MDQFVLLRKRSSQIRLLEIPLLGMKIDYLLDEDQAGFLFTNPAARKGEGEKP